MKTVGEFKKAGLVFVGNDMPDGIMKVSSIGAASLNANDCFDGMGVVGEFAWRENTGVKPEFGGLVEWVGDSGAVYVNRPDELIWSDKCIAKWRPSLNHPSAAKPDTKQSAIHKAWVDLKGDLSNTEKHDRGGRFLVVCIKDGISIKKGEYQIASHKTNNTEYWENVCTIQEFTDYCEKMAAEEKRIDIIGQNGNDGLHYDNTAQQVEALALKKPSEKMKVAQKEADDISGGFITRCLVFKPADKPIFTQAMADAWQLPPVGSEVSLRYKFDSKQIHITGKVLYASLEHCIIDGKFKECHYKMCDYIYEVVDTRTDREKAIDAAMKVSGKNKSGLCGFEDMFGKLYDAGLLKC